MSKPADKISIGILGCGPIAQFAHLEACQKASNVILYAVCDQAIALAQKMAAFYEAEKIFTQYEEMLEDPLIDAIIIATADAFHLPASILAIKAGKHVLVEKPLGDDLDQAQALKHLIQKKGLVFQVGHMKRFDAGIAYAREFIQNQMGEIIAYKGWYCDSTHRYDMTDSTQPVPVKSPNTKKPSKNPKDNLERYYMMAHGSHLLDTARFLAGKIISVQATLLQKSNMYSWFIDTEFANGCNGHLDLTIAVRMDWHEGFHIYGEAGSVLGKTFNPWYFKTSEVQCFSEKERSYFQPLNNKAHFFQLQLEAFASTILHGKQQEGTDIDQGIESIRGMMAIAQSVKSGLRVRLNDVRGSL